MLLKLQYFDHLMRRADSLEKTLMLGKIEGRRRRGRQKMRWLDDSMDMSLGNSGSWWWTGRPGVLWFMGSRRVGHNWVTELNWTELICLSMRPQNQNPSGLLPINVFKHMLWRKNWFRSSKFYCSFDLWVSLCLSFYFLIHCRLLIKSCLECMLILCSKLSLGRVHS